MAKAKKQAAKRELDPAYVELGRKLAVHGTIACLFFGGLAVGFYFVREYVQSQIVVPAGPPAVVIKNRPRWMSDFLVQRIADTARPKGNYSAFDREMLVEAREALEKNPWIAKVYDVRRAYGNGPGDLLEINCEYRVPVALVKWGDYYSLVDRTGFRLPEQYEAKDVPRIVRIEEGMVDIRIIEGVKRPPPEAGHKWMGEDLAAGLEMIALLSDKPYAQEILKINVAHVAAKGEPMVVLVTKYATEITWGRVPSDKDSFFEVDPGKKLERLQSVYAQYGRVDAVRAGGLDIRFDRVTYPGAATASASTESRR